jgi:hypothetical protein
MQLSAAPSRGIGKGHDFSRADVEELRFSAALEPYLNTASAAGSIISAWPPPKSNPLY